MYCLIQFYVQIKDEISEHSPFLKILSIKLVIFLSFWQTVRVKLVSIAESRVLIKRLDCNILPVFFRGYRGLEKDCCARP